MARLEAEKWDATTKFTSSHCKKSQRDPYTRMRKCPCGLFLGDETKHIIVKRSMMGMWCMLPFFIMMVLMCNINDEEEHGNLHREPIEVKGDEGDDDAEMVKITTKID